MKALLLSTIVIGVLALSCSTDSNPKMYRLTISVDPSEAGTVTPAQGEFEEGKRVQLTANLNVGGLIGSQGEAKTVSGSSADVAVTGNKNIGGLIGSSTNTREAVARSYATGDVFGEENVGGLIGSFSGYSSVGESYATGEVSSTNGTVFGG